PSAPVVVPCPPDAPGFVASIDTRAVGLAVVALGGGRTRADETIDHRVGLAQVAALGQEVGPDRPLAFVHAADESTAHATCAALKAAFQVGGTGGELHPVIYDRIALD